jgi:hypothetical protein
MKIIEKAAMDPQFDVAKLEHLLKVRDQWAATEARKAYNEAFAAFKAEAIVDHEEQAVTDGPLKGKKLRRALLGGQRRDAAPVEVRPQPLVEAHQGREGLDRGHLHAEARPRAFRVVTMGGPPDAGGAKNAIQARASTITYLERYTLKAVCGIAEQGDDTTATATWTAGRSRSRSPAGPTSCATGAA